MTPTQLIKDFKSTGNPRNYARLLEVLTLSYLVGSEEECLSYWHRVEVVDCYLAVKSLLEKMEKVEGL